MHTNASTTAKLALTSQSTTRRDPSRSDSPLPPDSRTFLSSISDPVVGLDRSFRYVFVNHAAERMKGRTAAQLLGKTLWEVFPEAAGTRFARVYSAAIQSWEPQLFEGYYAPHDAWYEIRTYPSDAGVWLWFRDISERKRAEAATANEAKRFRELFENSPAALYRTAPDGTLLDVNRALVALLGYPDRETFLRVNASDVYVDPDDRRRWRELLETNDRAVFEMRDRRYDGEIIWVRDTARAVRDGAGALVCYEGMLEDITAEKNAEQLVAEREDRFHLLARASEDVIWDWDMASGEVRWNEALRNTFGYDPDSIGSGIERSYAWWLARVHPEDRVSSAAALHDAVGSGRSSWTSEYRFRRRDGSWARVHDRGFIGRDADGRAVRMVGAMLDLTRRPLLPGPDLPPEDVVETPPVPATSDATLVAWVQRGDEGAFEELYRRHAAMVLMEAQRSTETTEDAEEVVADVFLQAWDQAGRYDPDRGTVTAWLNAMTRSRGLDRTRKRRRRARLLKAELEQAHSRENGVRGSAAPAGDTPGRIVDRVLVEDLFRGLSDAQRQVLELAYFRGHTHAEIAAKLDEPLGTIKTRIRDGVRRMRKGLNGGR